MPLKSHALTTLEAVRDELGLTGTSADARLERMINAASSAFAALAGRDLHFGTWTEDLTALGGARLSLGRFPVTEIVSIAPIDASGSAGGTLDSTSYFLENASLGFVRRVDGWGIEPTMFDGINGDYIAGSERPNWRVVYTGGSITPYQESAEGGSLGTATLRDDIEQAIIESVVDTYRRAGARSDILSERLGDESITYADPTRAGYSDRSLSPSARALAMSLRAVW